MAMHPHFQVNCDNPAASPVYQPHGGQGVAVQGAFASSLPERNLGKQTRSGLYRGGAAFTPLHRMNELRQPNALEVSHAEAA